MHLLEVVGVRQREIFDSSFFLVPFALKDLGLLWE